MSIKFSLEDVCKHNKKEDVYLAIDHQVYDCTQWVEHHPGGVEAILEFAGQNATEAFNDIQHSDDALKILDTFKIGSLKSGSHKVGRHAPSQLARKGSMFSITGITTLPVLFVLALLTVFYRQRENNHKLFGTEC